MSEKIGEISEEMSGKNPEKNVEIFYTFYPNNSQNFSTLIAKISRKKSRKSSAKFVKKMRRVFERRVRIKSPFENAFQKNSFRKIRRCINDISNKERLSKV